MNDMINAPFDEALVFERRKRALHKYPCGHFLMERVIEDANDRLLTVARSFSSPVTLFCGGQETANLLQRLYSKAEIAQLETDAGFFKSDGIIGSPANFGLKSATYDLAASLLAMHAVNDLAGFLIQSRMSLKPDGLFLGCLFGAGTLQELRAVLLETDAELYNGASPRIAPFGDVRDMGGLLQRAGFALPVSDSETLTVRYDSLFALIKDLRAMGLGNCLNGRTRKPSTKSFWQKANANYAAKYSDADGRIRATFSIIWLSGWAPSPSQPKALRPGSATVSLKDFLKS